MPLIKYSQYLTYPDGSPVADTTVPVALLGGNVLPPLFSNKAGTSALSNPVPTDSDGLAEFYAAPGAFFTDIAGRLYVYAVDVAEADDAWPGTFVHEQTTAAATWTVGHHFGIEPSVQVVVAGQVVEAEVSHTDDETTTISFGTPTSGVAYLRR